MSYWVLIDVKYVGPFVDQFKMIDDRRTKCVESMVYDRRSWCGFNGPFDSMFNRPRKNKK